MDHIPCSESYLWQHVRVPLLCEENYDGLAFSDYPLRKGWQDANSSVIKFDQHSQEEQSAFLQTWLFFGMLVEVLGVPVVMEDFVQDNQVTTRRLSEYTLQWYERLLSMSEDRRQECHMRAQQCLIKVRGYCLILLDETTPDCPLTPEVRLSIRILGESLSQTKHWIWRSILGRNPTGYLDVRGKWGKSRLLERLLLEKKWCPNHIAFLQNYPPASSNSGLYYASSLHRPRLRLHEDCSHSLCVAGKVDPKSYQTKHSDVILPTCDGNCPQIEPPLETIRTILQRGSIPLLFASISNDIVGVEVVEYRAGMEYVAISHIWSDGLGNQNHNWLPKCQIVHLIQAVKTAQKETHGGKANTGGDGSGIATALFWIDTICVPRSEDDITFRHMALARMAATYQDSAMVLVLDAELYHTSLRTNLEGIIRLICCNWMRRLWTLQEGILGDRRLHILFKSGTLDLWKELGKLKAEHKKTPWMCHPMISFAVRTGIQQSVRFSGPERMAWLFADMNWRSTTRQTDEALVLANMLGLDATNIYQIPAKNRMKRIISMMHTFPQRIIFAPGARFDEEGYRWVLRSFTECSPFSLSSNLGKVQTVFYPQLGSSFLSLSVSYPGYLLKGIPRQKPLWDFTVFDAEIKKWLHVRERQNSSKGTAITDIEVSEDYEALAPETASRCTMGLVLHTLSTDRIHTYGAVVWLDLVDAGERSCDALSGTHGGSVDIFFNNLGDNPPVGTQLGSNIGIECSFAKQTWLIR
jgi:hypothetical protein